MTAPLLEQKPLIEQYLKQDGHRLSSFSFANIFAWRDFFQFDLKIIGERLCVFAKNQIGMFLYLPPLGGDLTAEVVEECFRMMEEVNRGNGVSRIENVSGHQLSFFPPDVYDQCQKGYEYCYYKDDLIRLKGNKYKSKRSSRNHFLKNNACRYLPFEPSMTEECLALYQRWALKRKTNGRSDVYAQMIDENYQVHRLLMRYCRELGLIGRVVIIQNEIKAYTFGFEISPDIFCVLCEVADLDIKGLPVYVFWEFCQDPALRGYQFINVMDDFELENIQRTKMSFHPVILLSSYTVTKKKRSWNS